MKKITIDTKSEVKNLGDLFGLFFEDINHAADGGLYAELVQNRSFEFCELDRKDYHALTAWEKSEGIKWEVLSETPLNKTNAHYLHVEAEEGSAIYNQGFNSGIYTEEGKEYLFSVYARGTGKICVCVDGLTDAVNITINSSGWKKYEAVLNAKETSVGKLKISFAKGEYCLDMVSLFPKDTFMGRPYGLRKDIAEALMEMHPKFMRFPGGCLTHDGSLDINARNSMYRWIKTIGPIEERPSWRNNWGYNQTLGLGYFEYFQFCEDIGCEPLPVVPGGFNPHKGEGVALDGIGEWVDETLKLIEFANGDENSQMGRIRADMGHPESFNLKYVGVGNEEIGEGFFERYPYFHNAIREKYPDIKIINTAGPFAVGEGNEDGWRSAVKYGSDLVDEHYYSSPEWFLANNHHYDDYDANGPKVFLGEYASWGNTFYNALVEAAYMTHLEKAPAVALACYAPMLCNVDYKNWSPDMLWFNNKEILKTPNYYVQKMFMNCQGDAEVAFKTENLDEVIKLIDEDRLSGAFTITGNDIKGKIYNVRFEGEAGNTCEYPNFNVDTDNKEITLFENIKDFYYSVEFSFKREAGRKGLKICFGKHDNNFIMWEFGGWDNWDCNITSFINGKSSAISHRIFHVTDEEYRLRVEVNGRSVKAYVNGVLMNDTVDRLPELEELYIASSKDRAGNVFLKVVNLTGEDKEVYITLDDAGFCVADCEVLHAGLSDENTFDAKERVVPVRESKDFTGGTLKNTFMAHSVSIITFRKEILQ